MDFKIRRRVPFWFALSILFFSVFSGVLFCDIFLKEILRVSTRSVALNRSITSVVLAAILTPLVIRETHQSYPSFNELSLFEKISILIGLLLCVLVFIILGFYWLRFFGSSSFPVGGR